MGLFEQATVIVNQVSMFSANELIDEVSTESLPFMLLPYFLGKLTTKINSPNNTHSIELGEIYCPLERVSTLCPITQMYLALSLLCRHLHVSVSMLWM